MRSGGYYVFTMSRRSVVRPDVYPVPTSAFLFRFARILNWMRWHLREVITTINRWTLYILREMGPETTEDRKFASTLNRCCHTANAEASY